MRIGIFGGSFDPIHMGHLVIANEAFTQLTLDRMIVVPTANPPHKPLGSLTPIQDRLAMVRVAIRGIESWDTTEHESGEQIAYTVDTLKMASDLYGPDARLFLILGEDSLVDLENWKNPDEIRRLAELVVYMRRGSDSAEIEFPHRRLEGPWIDVSSTWVRDRVGRGEPIRFWVPEPVRIYIARHRLYGYRGGSC